MRSIELYVVLTEEVGRKGLSHKTSQIGKEKISLFNVDRLKKPHGDPFYYGRRIKDLEDRMGPTIFIEFMLVMLLLLIVADSDMNRVEVPFLDEEGGGLDWYVVWENEVIFHFGTWLDGKKSSDQRMKLDRREVVEDLRIQFRNLFGFAKMPKLKPLFDRYEMKIAGKTGMTELLESFLQTELGAGRPGAGQPGPYPEALRKLVEASSLNTI